MPQGKLGLDLVAVSPALSLPQDVALLDQLGEDPVGAALGDPDRRSDLAQADAGVMSDAQKDVGVVCQEVPAAADRFQRCLPCIYRNDASLVFIESAFMNLCYTVVY